MINAQELDPGFVTAIKKSWDERAIWPGCFDKYVRGVSADCFGQGLVSSLHAWLFHGGPEKGFHLVPGTAYGLGLPDEGLWHFWINKVLPDARKIPIYLASDQFHKGTTFKPASDPEDYSLIMCRSLFEDPTLLRRVSIISDNLARNGVAPALDPHDLVAFAKEYFGQRRTSTAQNTTNQLISFVNDNWSVGRTIAQDLRIDELSLRANVLLHLPRIIKEALPALTAYEHELWLIGKELEERQRPYLDWAEPPKQDVPELRDYRLVELSDEQAQVFHERFHYVGSYRRNSVNFGLVIPQDNKVACMASFNSFDIANLTTKVAAIAKPENVLVLSRSFAFRWAPCNAFSYMLRRALKVLRSRNRDLQAMVTYINPNLGFTGAQFNPLIWKPLALERGTSYSYVDGKYTTVRELISRFGTFERRVLAEMLGSRYVTSSIELEPLKVLIYAFGSRLFEPVPEEPAIVVRPQLLSEITPPH
jgi:hypothetical protein